MNPRQVIRAVGFDLDQTLYEDTPEIFEAARSEIAKVIAERHGFTLRDARLRFEEELASAGSGSKALAAFGIESAREVLRDCLDRAAVHRFLQPAPEFAALLLRMSELYRLFLITDSRRANAELKLEALGLGPATFEFGIYWDDPIPAPGLKKEDGSAFRYAAEHLGLAPAQIAFAGNSLSDDVIPAHALGWTAILIGPPRESPAKFSVRSVLDLEKVLA